MILTGKEVLLLLFLGRFLLSFSHVVVFLFWFCTGRIITDSAMRARASVKLCLTTQGRNTNARRK